MYHKKLNVINIAIQATYIVIKHLSHLIIAPAGVHVTVRGLLFVYYPYHVRHEKNNVQ